MKILVLLHLILISIWGGVLLAEFVIETLAQAEHSMRWAARTHYCIDILFELPLVLAILFTGLLLTYQRWPLTLLHWIKIICALIAIFLNLDCCRRVMLRFHTQHNVEQLKQHTQAIKISALGVPFGLIAFFLGFYLNK